MLRYDEYMVLRRPIPDECITVGYQSNLLKQELVIVLASNDADGVILQFDEPYSVQTTNPTISTSSYSCTIWQADYNAELIYGDKEDGVILVLKLGDKYARIAFHENRIAGHFHSNRDGTFIPIRVSIPEGSFK